MLTTRPLSLDRADAWAIHDCLQPLLAGFGGRHETTDPWHALTLMTKLRFALLALEHWSSIDIDLTQGELICIDFNVPRGAYQGAMSLLLRVFHALEELSYDQPLLMAEPDATDASAALAVWRETQGDLSTLE